jgi:hypothetical protein
MRVGTGFGATPAANSSCSISEAGAWNLETRRQRMLPPGLGDPVAAFLVS